MERLTRCVGYQNGNPIYKANIDMRRIGAVDKLKNALGKYEDLEEQGLLLRLPCKVGDTVYKIISQRDNFDDKPYKIVTAVEFRLSMFGEIGKTVFLSKTDAEQKLKEMKGVD